ncbi:MAG: chemotaxis protein CheA [Gammaproteobacteria bacterium]|nr:chemotaxis protein CheA [Gammaproteobacteria bacterium]MBI5614947.1 chemotaxis protein CheA [Gammaproteobacteria bacterium]
MNLDPALQTFFAESADLLDRMEEALLRLEEEAGNAELVNDVFRAAHTIKGTAGIFGFDEIVHFTHQLESLLDRIRDGEVAVTAERVALLLACGDHVRAIIEPVANGAGLSPELRTVGEALYARLGVELGRGEARETVTPAAVPVAGAMPAASVAGEAVAMAEHWHLSLRFGPEVLRNGMDPLAFLRYLTTLGDILHVEVVADALPEPARMDPEACYFGYEVAFRSTAAKAEIENVFEFVRDDLQLRMVPPGSKISEYVKLIQELPGEPMQIGEMLVRCGALTAQELAQGLARQADVDAEQQAAPEQHVRPIGEILVKQGAVESTVVSAALEKQQTVRDTKAQEGRFIRVEAEKIDQLINLVGELVIAGAGTQLLAMQAHDAAITESAANLLRLVESVRNTALGLRMVPIGATFQRFQRVVRDVSRELGKDIELVINGADTELDKSVVEKIGDPLMHLVRNAMDHGIEKPEVRVANGKPARAQVMLDAYHDSGSIVIEVSDDGAGLNRERILARAMERGLVAEAHALSEKEIYNLIFAAGFSTAEAVSNLSGRGVGMDVVRRNIEALRGTVELKSEPGNGTLVRIRLPLTLAIIDGFLIGVGAARYVIPVDMVVECVELTAENARSARSRGYTDLRGTALPCVWLRDVLDIGGARARRENIVVVQFGEGKAGLVVDDLLGESQTVIKPLGHLFGHLEGISGSTILGSGEVALIVDVVALIKRIMARTELEQMRYAPPPALSQPTLN